MKVRITKVPDKKQESLNARKWNHHADGGILDRMNNAYSGDTAAMLDAIQRIKEKRNG